MFTWPLKLVVQYCNFFKILLNHSVCTDPDQAMSEHLDKELVWNIQLLSQVHEHVTLCCGPVS